MNKKIRSGWLKRRSIASYRGLMNVLNNLKKKNQEVTTILCRHAMLHLLPSKTNNVNGASLIQRKGSNEEELCGPDENYACSNPYLRGVTRKRTIALACCVTEICITSETNTPLTVDYLSLLI